MKMTKEVFQALRTLREAAAPPHLVPDPNDRAVNPRLIPAGPAVAQERIEAARRVLDRLTGLELAEAIRDYYKDGQRMEFF